MTADGVEDDDGKYADDVHARLRNLGNSVTAASRDCHIRITTVVTLRNPHRHAWSAWFPQIKSNKTTVAGHPEPWEAFISSPSTTTTERFIHTMGIQEKDVEIQHAIIVNHTRRKTGSFVRHALLGVVTVCMLGSLFCYHHFERNDPALAEAAAAACPQTTPITPTVNAALLKNLEQKFGTTQFRSAAYESLGGAVRIP